MSEPYFVHPSSYVDEGAQIGAGTRIWHFCHVMGSARLGERCSLGQGVFVGERVEIGAHVRIQNNVSVYEGVTIEDYAFLGPSVVFTNVKLPRAAYPKGREGYARTLVRRGASLGANATVICGVTIGRWAVVGAGAVVSRDVPDYALVTGVPARLRGFVCECGERLRFEEAEARCPGCARRYARDKGAVRQR